MLAALTIWRDVGYGALEGGLLLGLIACASGLRNQWRQDRANKTQEQDEAIIKYIKRSLWRNSHGYAILNPEYSIDLDKKRLIYTAPQASFWFDIDQSPEDGKWRVFVYDADGSRHALPPEELQTREAWADDFDLLAREAAGFQIDRSLLTGPS